MDDLLLTLKLQPGDPVVVPPHGPVRVVGTEIAQAGPAGEPEPRLVIALPDGQRLGLSPEELLLKLRRLANRETAEAALALLQAPTPPVDADPGETAFEARMAVVTQGELVPLARLARLMRALREPSPGERSFLREIEAQVLREIGLVLGEDPAALEAGLRRAAPPAGEPRTAPAPGPSGGTRAPAAACQLHPRKSATDACAACLRPICEVCATADGARFLCPACARQHRRRRWMLAAAILLALAGAFGLVGYRLASSYEPAFDYGSQELEVKKLAHQLDRDPCDRVKMLRFAELLLEVGDHDRCAARSRRYLAECGEFDRLLWVTFEAEKRRGEYRAALADVDQLVQRYPRDKDFRWWRGEVHERLRDWPRALADYRQALGLQPRLRTIPFELARVAERAARPCEGIFHLEQAAYHHPDLAEDPELLLPIERLYRLPACAGMAGRGHALVDEEADGALPAREVALPGGQKALVLLELGVGLSLVTPELADRLGLESAAPEAEPFLLWDGREVREGWRTALPWVELDGARAERVEVLVTELGSWQQESEEPLAGILGLSFLSRFALGEYEGGIALNPKLED